MVWILMNVQHVDIAVHTSFFDSNLLLVHSTCRKKWTGSICFDMSKKWKNRSTCCQKRQHVERQHSTCCFDMLLVWMGLKIHTKRGDVYKRHVHNITFLATSHTSMQWLQSGASIPPKGHGAFPPRWPNARQFLIIMHLKCCADRWHDLPVLWQSFWN